MASSISEVTLNFSIMIAVSTPGVGSEPETTRASPKALSIEVSSIPSTNCTVAHPQAACITAPSDHTTMAIR